MKIITTQNSLMRARYDNQGSILIYVLWILVVISVLAFQLTSSSKATTLNQVAFGSQLKKRMQINSAIQFAIFQIRADRWQNRSFAFDLNNQEIAVSIYNESGFVSIYETDNETLGNIFEYVQLEKNGIAELTESISDEDHPQRFNSFSELLQFTGLDSAVLHRLIPLVSIFHEDTVNPMLSPPQVLMRFHRVDQFRVQQLLETANEAEIEQLRSELVASLRLQDSELSGNVSGYFRLHVEIDGSLNRVFIKKLRRQENFQVVLIENDESTSQAKSSELEKGN